MTKTLLERTAELVRNRLTPKPQPQQLAAAKRRTEKRLRAQGFSRNEAKTMVSRKFPNER